MIAVSATNNLPSGINKVFLNLIVCIVIKYPKQFIIPHDILAYVAATQLAKLHPWTLPDQHTAGLVVKLTA